MERLPRLGTQQRQARLSFAKANLNRNWENVIFSHEKMFYAHTNSGRMWGWISQQGPGELTFIPKRLDSVAYTEILEEVSIPSVQICYGSLENVIFMQVRVKKLPLLPYLSLYLTVNFRMIGKILFNLIPQQ